MSEELSILQREIGYEFHEPKLLLEAVTHKSYAAERNVKYDNQRLEFFGDAVVELVLTKHLYFRYPALQEGDLTKIRSALVNQDSLARFARSCLIPRSGARWAPLPRSRMAFMIGSWITL